MSLLFLVILISPVVVLIAVNRNHRRSVALRSATVSISADADGARRTLADGRQEEITWEEVTEVDVFTTRVGPHKSAGGAVVLYGDESRGCVVPLDQLEASGLLVYISRLPGFDLNRLIGAVTRDEQVEQETAANPVQFLKPKPLQTTVVCWQRDNDDTPRGNGD